MRLKLAVMLAICAGSLAFASPTKAGSDPGIRDKMRLTEMAREPSKLTVAVQVQNDQALAGCDIPLRVRSARRFDKSGTRRVVIEG